MSNKLTIPCVLEVTPPKNDTMQAKIRLSVEGYILFDKYEEQLGSDYKSFVGDILLARAQSLKDYGEKLQS